MQPDGRYLLCWNILNCYLDRVLQKNMRQLLQMLGNFHLHFLIFRQLALLFNLQCLHLNLKITLKINSWCLIISKQHPIASFCFSSFYLIESVRFKYRPWLNTLVVPYFPWLERSAPAMFVTRHYSGDWGILQITSKSRQMVKAQSPPVP